MEDPHDTALLRIATWNVHMGLHNDGGRNDLVARCKEIDADVLVLQEAWWWGESDSDMAGEIATAVGGQAFSYSSPSPLKRYQAKWTVAIVTTLAAERLPDVSLVSMNGRERVMVQVRLSDHDLVVTGAHLDGIHSARTQPWVWRRQRADFRRHTAATDILAGDLNMWSPIVHRDSTGLRGAVSGRTWPAWRPHSQIDHILVGDRLGVVDSEVLPDMGSDHRAVRATLQVMAPRPADLAAKVAPTATRHKTFG